MTANEISKCKRCGGELKRYDKVKRIVRAAGGQKYWINVERFRCVICHKIHRVLPDTIFPYKQYGREIIEGVLTGHITPDTLGYEDYPSEMTMKRWASQK